MPLKVKAYNALNNEIEQEVQYDMIRLEHLQALFKYSA